MGARQSKRSVDITTTPKKEGIPAEGVGDAAAPGDGKLERIEEADTKPTTNGIAPHTDTAEDKEKDKDEATEKDKEQVQPQQEEVKPEETKQESSSGDSPAEVAEVTTPTEATPASPNTATSPDSKETKKKDKKKKWSFRSISFSKKDKTKPSREETPKNGDVTKEEPLAEGGEEGENATASASSPAEEKSAASSPSADEQVAAPVAAAEPKEEAAAASPAAASPAEEKKEEPTPSAPTPIPSVEDKKEEAVEKVEAEKKVVEVSQSVGGQSVTDPVEVPVYRVQPVATPSIIERKTSEDLPSLPPSSPPPTPIDPSPLQQARQAAASATALAEALKLPAVSAVEEQSTLQPDVSRVNVPQQNRAESTTFAVASPPSLGPHTDLSPTEATFVLAEVECAPEIEVETSRDEARETVASSLDNERVMKPVELKAECVSESPVVIGEISKCQENEAKEKLNEPLDNKGESAAESKVECLLVPEEVNPLASSGVKESDKSSVVVTFSTVGKVSDAGAIDKVMNEALPVAECQIKSEINSREGAMKINVASDAGHNEKAEVATLLSTEIETNGASPTTQHLSSENFEIAKTNNFPNETLQLPSYEKCVAEAEKSSEINSASSTQLIESPSEESNAEQLCKRIEYEHGYAKDAATEAEEEKFINSEEGPLSVSDILVEAKPAVVIPEDDSVEELTDTTESVKVIPETDEEKIENEFESDAALPTEETLISEELEDISAPEDAAIEQQALNELAGVPDSFTRNVYEKTFDIEDALPSPPEDLAAFNSQTPELQSAASAFEAEPIVASPSQTEEGEGCFLSPKDRVAASLGESCPLNDSEPTPRSPSRLSDAPTNSLSERHSNESQTRVLSPESESVPISLEDLPPAPEDTGSQSLDSFDYPLPPEELSCPLPPVVPSNASVLESPPPAPVEHAANPRDPTETFLTPPVSPSYQFNINLVSGIATETATKDRSQIPTYDQDDSEQSLSKPQTNSCDQMNIELKGRLTTKRSAETESQEGALSYQLSNTVPSIATKEDHHQIAPEIEAPVENNIIHDVSTTESADEAPKVAPPAIPTEAPASPPTAPAITEDVASVTKAIEEIDISDKAVAAAVNEAIECNTNEIIADAHHQNNINE